MRMLVGLVLLLSACSFQQSRTTLPERAGQPVTITTIDGVEAPGTIDTQGNIRYVDGRIVPPEAIRQVAEGRTLRGAAGGLAIGLGIGGVLGAVTGFGAGDDPPCNDHICSSQSASTKAIYGAVGFGLLGAIGGLVAGLALGSDDVYEFSSAGTAPLQITPGGPPGSTVGITLAF